MNPEGKQHPPKWTDRLLQWFCSEQVIETLQGDLHELYIKRRRRSGKFRADLYFFLDVIDVCRPFALKRRSNPNNLNYDGIFQNYFKAGSRNLIRNKSFSTINIFGLAIGMAAFFLIIQYVDFELNYDKFHQNSDRIYRVIIDSERSSSSSLIASNHPGTGPSMKTDFPEVEEYARIIHQSIFMGEVTTWSYIDEPGREKIFNEARVFSADPSFLTMFSFPFVFGDPGNALTDINSVVISQSVSEKFFGPENPLGKTLTLNGRQTYNVTGVFKDIPGNSHIKFDLLISSFLKQWSDGEWLKEKSWVWPEFYTYVRLTPQADPKHLETKLEDFVVKYTGDLMKEWNFKQRFLLQPLTDIHLGSSNIRKEIEVRGSERTVYFLLGIATLILVIAWINYINLSTSTSIKRAREVGLRKVVGASKPQLITQFLLESAMVNLLAILCSFILIFFTYPFFGQLAGKNMGDSLLESSLISGGRFWLILSGVFILGSFLAGLYPAFVLSSFRIVTVLKGKFFGSKSGIILRKTLVGSQFVISVALIAGTIMVYKQVSFMRNQELGYSAEQLLVIKSPSVGDSTIRSRMTTFKTELMRNPEINGLAPSSQIPGKLIPMANSIRNFGEGTGGNVRTYHYMIDRDFFDTFGLDIVAGRNFRVNESRDLQDTGTIFAIMVNEQVTESLGYSGAQEAIDQLVYFAVGTKDWVGKIVGVVENFNQQSLREGYDPILFFPFPGFSGQYITINLNMIHPDETISFIEDQYRQAFPGNQFDYFFLDDFFDRQYAADQQFGKLFGLFSGLALAIACLGLLGLSTFMISQRTKEIAVRKVLGSTIPGMIHLFSKDFIRLIVAANLIALPVVYFFIRNWLSDFAFRTNIGWSMFIVPAIVLLVISLTTVSIQTIRTGSMNATRFLRSE